jgi:hypothetical protein
MDVRRSINTRIWVDEWFDELEATDKLLFLYLLTNQATNLLGIYEESIKRMVINTGLSKEAIKKGLERFSHDRKVYYVNGWVWVVNQVKNQSWNPKMLISAKNHLEALDPTIKQAFKELNNDAFDRLFIDFDSLSIAFDKKEKGKSKKEIEIEIEKKKVK